MAHLVEVYWSLIEVDVDLANKLRQLSKLKRNLNIIDERYPQLLYDNYISIELRLIDDSLQDYNKIKIVLYGPHGYIELKPVIYASKLSNMWSKMEVSGFEVDMKYLKHYIGLAMQELSRT